jgi:regulator of protease activity HflC (stomatin/prohibitin superfamily)
MMSSTFNTNAVQNFIRSFVFIITFSVLMLVVSPFVEPFDAMGDVTGSFVITVAIIGFISLIISKMFFILPEWQAMIVLRLGKYDSTKGAGFFIIPPFIYSIASILDLRIETRQVEATATLTADNVPIDVTAAIEYKIEDPKKAVMDVQDYRSSVIWLSNESLKNTIGSLDLKDLLSDRDRIAASLKVQIDNNAKDYGVDVRAVRITDINTPQSLIEELAVIARAKRAAEAKKLQAEAEIMVAEKIREASSILTQTPGGIKLRELSVLSEISKEESSMVIVYPYGDSTGMQIASALTATKK